MLDVVMLNAVMLNVVMLSVLALLLHLHRTKVARIFLSLYLPLFKNNFSRIDITAS